MPSACPVSPGSGHPHADHARLVEVAGDVLPDEPEGKALVARRLRPQVGCVCRRKPTWCALVGSANVVFLGFLSHH